MKCNGSVAEETAGRRKNNERERDNGSMMKSWLRINRQPETKWIAKEYKGSQDQNDRPRETKTSVEGCSMDRCECIS